MKIVNPRKLKLDLETLKLLADADLARAIGGAIAASKKEVSWCGCAPPR